MTLTTDLEGNMTVKYDYGERYSPIEAFNLLRSDTFNPLCNDKELSIDDINIIVPNKVIEVSFNDGTKEKVVCHKDDTFNLRNGLFIAIAKHLYKQEYTQEGIEWKAFELTHLKKYAKIVDSALKNYHRKLKDIEKSQMMTKAEEERIERKRIKKLEHAKRRAAKREEIEKEKQIEIQKEAYIRAMKSMKEEK